MRFKLVSVLGVLVAVACLGTATTMYPGGFNWNRDFISTLLRGPSGPARTLADVGVLLFCASLALVFERLASADEFSKHTKIIRVSGIGAMVYAALTITPMHDLMVTISLIFLMTAIVQLTAALYVNGKSVFYAAGGLCLAFLVVSATIYYTGFGVSVLPWAQRASFGLLTVWILALDWRFSSPT